MRVRNLRSALVLGFALCLGLVPLLHATHAHEPCHRGLHVGPPHEAGPTVETCALCRTAPSPGGAPTPASSIEGLGHGHASCVAPGTRSPAAAIVPASPPRAPPSLLDPRI